MNYSEMIKLLMQGHLVTRESFYGQYIHFNPSQKNFFCYDCSTEDGTRFEYFFSKEDIYAEDWKVYSRE
jgi:hypothetical protein